jgi:hypothetical protein
MIGRRAAQFQFRMSVGQVPIESPRLASKERTLTWGTVQIEA